MSDDPREPLSGGDGGEPLDEISDDDLGPDGGDDGQEEAPPEEADVGEADEEDQDQGSVAPQPATRGSPRVRRIVNENAELRERLARLEGAQSVRSQPLIDPAQAAQQQRERFQAEFNRRFQEDPAAAQQWMWDIGQQQFGQAIASSEQRIMDRQDQREFDALCRSDRLAARYKDQVERDVQTLKSQGMIYVDRQMLLDRIVGQDMRRRASQEGPRQRAQAQRRVQRQTTRPGSGRGDGAANRGRRGSEDEDDIALLRNTPVGSFGV